MAKRPAKHTRAGMQGGGISANRIDELLRAGRTRNYAVNDAAWATGIHVPDIMQIERLANPEAATRIRSRIGEMIIEHADPRAWELLPANRIAFSVINHGKIRELANAAPGFAGLPRATLEAFLRGRLSETAGLPSGVHPVRLSVSQNDADIIPVRIFVKVAPELAKERAAATAALKEVSDVPLGRGNAYIVLGATTLAEANHPGTEALIQEATAFVAGLGGVAVEPTTIFYPGEGIRNPLY